MLIPSELSAPWRGQTVLVTGAAGFIGSHLSARLVEHGATVTAIDAVPDWPDSLHTLQGRITYQSLDLLEDDFAARLKPEGYDCIFHLAGNGYVPASVAEPVRDFDRNLRVSLALLERLRQASATSTRVVFASSAAVYGTPRKLPMEESDQTEPLSPYGVSKLAGENYARVFARLYGLRTVSARVFSCYGPRQRKLVVYDLLQRLVTRPERLTLLGDGRQVRDFVYVADVAAAFMQMAHRAELVGETYNVASGRSHSIAELVETMCRLLNWSPSIEYSGQGRPGEPDIWEASIERLNRIGFHAATSLEDGLRETINWLGADMGRPPGN